MKSMKKKFFEKIKKKFNIRKVNISDLLLSKQVVLLTTNHTIFVAEFLKTLFQQKDFVVEIKKSYDIADSKKLHIIICPQVFKEFPPYYIGFQMEQLRESKWWNKKYKKILEQSLAIFDYSQFNIEYLVQEGVSANKIFYLPISYLKDYRRELQIDPKEGILFYGGTDSVNRNFFLEKLNLHFKIEVVDNLFGDEILNKIAKAKIVLNIHYYPKALLETTRIYECLSLGALVVSEESKNSDEYPELKHLISFTPEGDVMAMCNAITKFLENDKVYLDRINKIRKHITENSDEVLVTWDIIYLGLNSL